GGADGVRHDQGRGEGRDDRAHRDGGEAGRQIGHVAKTALVHSDDWQRFDYGPEHPLRMERLGLTWRLMEAYGLTALPRAKVWAPERAELEEIARFHSREYIEILRAVSAGDWVPNAAGYGLGPGDNPIFPGLWEAAQLGAGGSLLAARLV